MDGKCKSVAEALDPGGPKNSTETESDGIFRRYFEMPPDASGIFVPFRDEAGDIVDFRVRFVNSRACLLYGTVKELLEGNLLCELFPYHRDTGLFDECRRVAENGIPARKRDYVLERDDGQGESLKKVYDISVSPFEDGVCVTWRDVTEESGWGDQSEENWKRMEELVRISVDGILVLDDEGVVKFANPAAESMLGKEPGGAVGYHLGYPSESGQISEITILRENSEPSIVQMRAVQTEWEGKPAFVVNLHDVTRARDAERSLRDSELKHRTLFETMSSGVVYRNAEGFVVSANPAAERILGLSYERMQCLAAYEPCRRLIREDGSDVPNEAHPCMQALRTGRAVFGTVMGLPDNADGPRWLNVTAVPMFRPGEDRPYQVYSIFEDITANKEKFDQAQLLGAIVGSTDDAIISRTIDGVITSWNPGAERMYGYSAEEAVGRPIADLIPDLKEDDLPTMFEKLGNGKSLNGHETVRRTKEGKLIYVSINLSPIYDEAGSPAGASAIVRDISKLREAGLELEKKSIELEGALALATQREKQTWSLLDGARAALKSRSFETSARGIFDACCRATGAISGYVALLSAEGDENEVLFLDSGGLPCDVDPELPMPVRGLRAEAYRGGQVVWDNNFMESEWVHFMPSGHLELRNVLFAPLLIEGKAVGVLGLANKPGGFSHEDANVAGVFGDLAANALHRDLIERKLRESEARYRLLAENTLDCIWMVDLDFRVTYINPSIESLLGYSPDEFIGTLVSDHCDDERFNGTVTWNEFPEALESTGLTFETNLKHKDGRDVPVMITGKAVRDGAGRPFALQGTAKDITERKRVEDRLRESESFLTEIGNMARVGGWEIDQETETVFWTQTTKALHEVPDDYVPTVEKAVDFFAPEVRSELLQAITRARELGIPYDMELPFVTAKGKRLWTRTVCKPEFRDGKCVRLRGTFQDITELKQAMDRRFEMEAQFQQAQKLESIGRLAGGVAHDFNNMLSVILGYGEEIHAGLHQGDPLREAAEEILEAVKRSSALTRQLLAFSRKQTLLPVVLSLNDIVIDLEKMLRRVIGEDVELSIRLAEDLSNIEVDLGQIEQVIMNLAVNARDAMPQGGSLILETGNVNVDERTTSRYPDLQPGAYVKLSVTDTGCGMDEETRKNIFEPFFTTKEKSKGTGLGLSTVYGIVRQSGGSIQVHSEIGQGSTFEIYLPASGEAPAVETVRTEEKSVRGAGQRILVVEDEPSLQRLCHKTLKRLGYEVTVASNGGEALLLVEEKGMRPDLIITDVVMPGMSGKDLVDQLRRLMPGLRVIYMSGYTDDVILDHGILGSGTPFIEKPFDMNSLAQLVQDRFS